MKKVFYLGYYDIPENKDENRNICLAAVNKMTYIVSALEKSGYDVTVVSASQTQNLQKYAGKVVNISKDSNLVLFPTLPWGNKIKRILSTLYSRAKLISYIFKNINSEDTLLVYHSVAYANIVRVLKKIKKFNLVLEVEEIYADVNNSAEDRSIEQKIFDMADAYIFPTELLNEKINVKNKPFCISYGTYAVEEERYSKFNDGKIHVVYAGTFDPRKGGALASLSAVPHLDSNYHMHIIGFGNEEDTKNVKSEIERLSQNCECKVTYDGLLTGEYYIRFLQSCHIGMSTQNPEGGFNDTSFPSKILSYMANGLSVVTIRIKVLEESEINSNMFFYENNNGELIAQAIKSVELNNNNRDIIANLDNKTIKEIDKILRG